MCTKKSTVVQCLFKQVTPKWQNRERTHFEYLKGAAFNALFDHHFRLLHVKYCFDRQNQSYNLEMLIVYLNSRFVIRSMRRTNGKKSLFILLYIELLLYWLFSTNHF